jgi:hypothetical protein
VLAIGEIDTESDGHSSVVLHQDIDQRGHEHFVRDVLGADVIYSILYGML